MPDASDAVGHDDELLVLEPVTWLDGSPVTQTRRWTAAGLSTKLGLPGVVALAEGLALLCCFSLPWFSMLSSAFRDGPASGGSGDVLVSLSGWSIAHGMPVAPNASMRLALFVHLWLIPMAAGTLLIIAWLCAQRRVSDRLAAGAVLALSLLTLLIGLGYYVQIASLTAVMNASPGDPSPIGVSWGYWLAMALNAVALAASANLFRPSRAVPPAAGAGGGSAGGNH